MLDHVLVLAQQAETGNAFLEASKNKFLFAIGIAIVCAAGWVGAGIVFRAKDQQTTQALGIGGRVLIGATVASLGVVILTIGAKAAEWFGSGI